MLITIIIPIYNRAKTLPECLDSIINQEHSEFECLLIDDGSHDDSLKVCNDYADKDSRFRVFHKTNGGVGSARNLGLENATGEWVAFVDSDDIITPNHLSQFATAIQKYVNMFAEAKKHALITLIAWRSTKVKKKSSTSLPLQTFFNICMYVIESIEDV